MISVPCIRRQRFSTRTIQSAHSFKRSQLWNQVQDLVAPKGCGKNRQGVVFGRVIYGFTSPISGTRSTATLSDCSSAWEQPALIAASAWPTILIILIYPFHISFGMKCNHTRQVHSRQLGNGSFLGIKFQADGARMRGDGNSSTSPFSVGSWQEKPMDAAHTAV